MSERLHTTEELEARLDEDELRLARDEQRLLADEARLEAEEAEVRGNRIVAWLGVGLALALTLAVAALVVAILALREDVSAIGRAAPDGSVSTESLRDASVTSEKLAPGAVTRDAVGGGAIGREQLERDAVSGAQVAPNTLKGGDIAEGSLATVPSASRARAADDAARLGGLPARVYLSGVVDARATSLTDAQPIKGPLTARCPAGTRVVSGGAAIRGAAHGAAIVDSAPDGAAGWTATARVVRRPAPAWQLVVSAICARGGE
jgi:hypothetical protein